ncbi:MAG: ADP-ribosylglycohydrolase family protein [Clostridia bacterium]|nr:ADP-ribosylglycohydrolase family protein [Clostridia bacterium]
MEFSKEIVEKIYSGWLGKVIGVRLGSPIEGMWYHSIGEKYGEITDYLYDYDLYAADDDLNGPLFFLRALEDGGHGKKLTAEDVGRALLDYAPYEHGFFWWGGYGISTEHTAYLNLRAGVPAGVSGSVALNGETVAEQIGGQIFIDTWGLVTPGDPDLTAHLAEKAASVTHGGNGIYGGIFVAVCVSLAFIESNIEKIIEKALTYIPADSEYARVTNAVREFYGKNPDDWRACYLYVRENFGYDKYPGNCHIIPNAAVVVLSLLYSNGDYSRAVCIANMCGWDTDCNAGNVGAIMGVLCGLDSIDNKWVKPINDLMICSSVVGKYNISTVSENALFIARQAAALAVAELPEPYKTAAERTGDATFELPRSTCAVNVLCAEDGDTVSFEKKRYAEGEKKPAPRYALKNTDATAASGARSLEIAVKRPKDKEKIFVYKKTYYHPSDFSDSRYDPEFSPVCYPGQTVRAAAFIPSDIYDATAAAFCYDKRHDKLIYGERVALCAGEWQTVEVKIPRIEAGLIECVGVCFETDNPNGKKNNFVCNVDDLEISGKASYTVDFSRETRERWNWRHIDISQFTRVKGIFRLDGEAAHLSGADFAEVFTGDVAWRDYKCALTLSAVEGREHYLLFRVQGAMRYYAVGFKGDEFCLMKNYYGLHKQAGAKVRFERGREYKIEVEVTGNKIKASLEGAPLIEYVDEKDPLLFGSVGMANRNGSHTKYIKLEVR